MARMPDGFVLITKVSGPKMKDGKAFADVSIEERELVMCKSCKYSDVIYDTTSDTMPLKCLNIRYGGVMPDWYCEHGERRDDIAQKLGVPPC